jgi:hypothetical protein
MLQPPFGFSSHSAESCAVSPGSEARDAEVGRDEADFTTQRADCCSSRAAYRVLLAGGHDELLFCGHHFRVARSGLYESAARAYDGANRLVLA